MILLASFVPVLLGVICFVAIIFAFIVYNESTRRRGYYPPEDYEYYDIYHSQRRNLPTYYPPQYPTPYQPPQWMPPPRRGYQPYLPEPFYEYEPRQSTSNPPFLAAFIVFVGVIIVLTLYASQDKDGSDYGNGGQSQAGTGIYELEDKPSRRSVPKQYREADNAVYPEVAEEEYQGDRLEPKRFDQAARYKTQAGSFGQYENAANLATRLESLFDDPVEIVPVYNEYGEEILYRVYIGRPSSYQAASQLGRALLRYNLEAGIPVDLTKQ
ncbi:MAG: SPOR domain-containing protein [Saprospiraceae bacterium]